ncbi:hypothetical protein BGX21_008220 [Mortierella sp. AD011]|nr:hypothetical protein BGX20_008389 [Mortierella sp. AD010]KAF9398052.1 hypothetical protein BGX21_008220 [Mortierella sp. AD011]
MPNDITADAPQGGVRATMPHAAFNLSKVAIAETNFQIDQNTQLKTPPDTACIVKIAGDKEVKTTLGFRIPGDFQTFSYDFYAKPCAAYLHYVESKTIPGDETHTFRKFKGFTTRFDTSVSITSGISAGVFECNVSLEVTTNFSYGQEITEQTEETWTSTIHAGNYVVFQPVIVYAYRIAQPQHIPALTTSFPNIKFHKSGSDYFIFAPVFRNSPFTVKFENDFYDDVPYDTLIDYLVSDEGFAKWH